MKRTLLAAALVAAACSSGGNDTSGPRPDTTPPAVISTSPADGAMGVAAAATIGATFSEAVDPATVTADTFTISEGVTGTVALDGHTATLTPSAPLASTTTYTATLTAGVKDVAGNALASAHAWTFTTGDFAPPGVLSTSPAPNATGVPLDADISVTFSEPVAPATVTATSFTVTWGTTGSVVGLVSVAGSTATFTPTSSLLSGTTYTVHLAGTIADLAGNPLPAIWAFSFTTLDDVAPAIVLVDPAADAAQVPTDAAVEITFSEPVDPATVNAGTFSIAGVLGTILVDGARATLTPSTPLSPDASYDATVGTGVKDLAGNALAAPYSWTFHTVDTLAPVLVARSPGPNATGVAVGAEVVVTFSEPVDPATVTATSLSVSGVAGTVAVDGPTATFTPSAALAESTTYTVAVSTAVRDLFGNALATPAMWSFRTLDSIPPTVVSTAPSVSATSVATNVTIRATFSEDVRASSVTSSTLTVTRGGVAVTGTIGVAGPEVTFDPAAALLPQTTYTVTLTTGVTDLAGNALASAYGWTFTTVNNVTPIASAGGDQNASFAQNVTLDGSGSRDPDGPTLTYAWSQVGGPAVTLNGATTASPTFTAPSEVSTLTFRLVVRDANSAASTADDVTVRVWVDRTRIVLVSTTGFDSASGAWGSPMRTLAAGLARAASYGAGGAVYAAGGTYAQGAQLDVTGAVGVYGGFNGATWERSVPSYPTVVNGYPVGFTISSANGAKLNGLTINPSNATVSGGSSIGVLVRSSQSVEIAGCTIRSGFGAAGLSGTSGGNGSSAYNGGAGGSGACNCETYGCAGAGGAGGSGAYAGGSGGRGGYATSFDGGTGGYGAGPGGAGGSGGTTSEASGASGWSGGIGASGGQGSGGGGFGSFGVGGYFGFSGSVGGSGSGGGGGGGGGGSAGQYGWTVDDGAGNGGGGGGGGGHGGYGGAGGTPGGGSFGVLVANSTGVTIRDGSIASQAGGSGGAGGYGGAGGAGGYGGSGNTYCASEVGRGGNGGSGGRGGYGGRGGGAGGGPSIALLEDLASVTTRTGLSLSNAAGGAGGQPNGVGGLVGTYVKR